MNAKTIKAYASRDGTLIEISAGPDVQINLLVWGGYNTEAQLAADREYGESLVRLINKGLAAGDPDARKLTEPSKMVR